MREPFVRENEPSATPGRQPRAGRSEAGVAAPMVERAFNLLDLLASSEVGYSLSELARLLEMSKGSAFGLLRTLENGGVVEIDENRRYALGPRLYYLTQAYIRRSGFRRYALPAMQRLAARTGETVFLGLVESDGIRIMDLVEVPSAHTALRLSARSGANLPLLAGATGRVVLATWPEARRQEYLRHRPLPHFTEYSITDPDEFLAATALTAQTGVGIDREEYLVGVSAVASAVHGLGGELLALIWIVGFSADFTDEALERAGPGPPRGDARRWRGPGGENLAGKRAAQVKDSRYTTGMRVRREVLGDEYVERALAQATEFDADFQRFITEVAWGSLWARPDLDRRSRSLITIAILAALGRQDELALHLRASQNNGVEPGEIREALLHVAVYAGIPAANSAFAVAKSELQGTAGAPETPVSGA